MDDELKKDYLLPASVVISAVIISASWIYKTNTEYRRGNIAIQASRKNQPNIENAVQPKEIAITPEEAVLPVRWGGLGMRLVRTGVIDAEKAETLYQNQSGRETMRHMLADNDNGNIAINSENSGALLNLFWALGLGNKNAILETGPMSDLRYGGAGNFASTGGWTLAEGGAMEHYSRHSLIVLTPDQQKLVERVAKNIYRPCCNNPTHFPDCNHGMAMLGFLELMASQGVLENGMYKAALTLNSFWFPDNYRTIAAYMKSKGIVWQEVNPKEMLGINYSSASGYARIAAQVVEPRPQQGGGCSVDSGKTIEPQRKPSGCGI